VLFKKYVISMKFNVEDTSLSIAFAFNLIYWECGRFFLYPSSSIQGLHKEGSVQRSIVALDHNRYYVINLIMIFRTSFKYRGSINVLGRFQNKNTLRRMLHILKYILIL
jgi:hypothetical protein